MTNNGLSIANGTADIELSDGSNSYGFTLVKDSPILERRGSQYAANVAQEGGTYKDASPYQRHVYRSWAGGFGQIEEDAAFGGFGQGGDPARFMDSDGFTLKGTAWMPGMARNMVYPTTSTSNLNDEWEVPRGVLPSPNGWTAVRPGVDTAITGIRILVKLDKPDSNTSVTVSGTFTYDNTAGSGTFSATITAANYDKYLNFKWLTLTGSSFTLLSTDINNLKISTSYATTGVYIGCFVGGFNGTINPYFQLCKSGSTDTYKQWDSTIKKFEVLNNSGTWVTIAISNSKMWNVASPGTAALSLGGTFVNSVVVDNALYVAAGSGTTKYTAAQAATNSAGTFLGAFGFGSYWPIGSSIYTCGSGNDTAIYKWDGTSTYTAIIASGNIGKPSTNSQVTNPINHVRQYKGMFYAFKPEGIFEIWEDITKVASTTLPRIIPLIAFGEMEHPDNCKYVVEHQGKLFFNVRHMVYMLDLSDQGSQISVLVPPFTMGRFIQSNYVNGIASDGQTLYVSYCNVGIQAFTGTGWHKITDFYEQVSASTQSCGLRFVNNPTGNYDYLYCGDDRYLLQIPMPSLRGSSFSQQFYLQDQNKCGYLITGLWDADQANITKFIKSIALHASTSGLWKFKVIGAVWQGGDPNFRTIINKTFNEGLLRDKWVNSSAIASTDFTPKGTIYGSLDFQNQYGIVEYDVSANDLTGPVKVANVAFILYAWNLQGSQFVGSPYAKNDIVYLRAMIVKYQSFLNYLPMYSLQLDLDALWLAGSSTNRLTLAQFQDTVSWLRSMLGRKSPLQLTFKDNLSGGGTKVVKGNIINPQIPHMAYTAIADSSTTTAPLQPAIHLDFMSTEEEYTS